MLFVENLLLLINQISNVNVFIPSYSYLKLKSPISSKVFTICVDSNTF